MIQFDYTGYRGLLSLLNEFGYEVANYHTYPETGRCVILRHDVDNSISAAVKMAELEAELGVKATYFILLRTDFYNPASAATLSALRRIASLGHELGLHFDEKAYPARQDVPAAIGQEVQILSQILEQPVTVISMHRPSRETLDANYVLPGLVNSYGQTFFKDFKYLSDSRRRWREPAEDIIRSGDYTRLHILTHPFWYGEEVRSMELTVRQFVNDANQQRYAAMRDNITNLASIMPESQVIK